MTKRMSVTVRTTGSGSGCDRVFSDSECECDSEDECDSRMNVTAG